jgi:hypothetical protein
MFGTQNRLCDFRPYLTVSSKGGKSGNGKTWNGKSWNVTSRVASAPVGRNPLDIEPSLAAVSK